MSRIPEVPLLRTRYREFDDYVETFPEMAGVYQEVTDGIPRERLDTVYRINELTNRIPYVGEHADQDHWTHVLPGDREHYHPDLEGGNLDVEWDCDNFVLRKRWHASLFGVGLEHLRPVICMEVTGLRRHHLLLAVQIGRDHLLLDNVTNKVKHWGRCRYRFLYILGQGTEWHMIHDQRRL